MTAYIEYVFLENFLLDGLLLFGAHRCSKIRVHYGRLCLSAGLGGIYALLSPFILLPAHWNWLLKFCIGALLCLCTCGRLKKKKDWYRYAFFFASFVLFTFMVAGFLLSVWNKLPQKPPFLAVLVSMVIGVGVMETFFTVHRRKMQNQVYLYSCFVIGKTRVKARGYLDSGNVAKKNGLPICFLSPLTFYEAFSYTAEGEQTMITTVAGEKSIRVYKGELCVRLQGESVVREVYFSPTSHMVFREYEIILPACIIEEA